MPRATRAASRKKQPEPEPEPEMEQQEEETEPTEEELVASIHEEWEKMETEPEPVVLLIDTQQTEEDIEIEEQPEVVDLTKGDDLYQPHLIKVKGYPKSEPGYREDGLYEEGFVDALRENGHELIDLTAPGKRRKLLYLGIRSAAGKVFQEVLNDADASKEVPKPTAVFVVMEENQMVTMVLAVAGLTLAMDRLMRLLINF